MALKSSDLTPEQEDASAALSKRKAKPIVKHKERNGTESEVLRRCLDYLCIRAIFAWVLRN